MSGQGLMRAIADSLTPAEFERMVAALYASWFERDMHDQTILDLNDTLRFRLNSFSGAVNAQAQLSAERTTP